MSNTRQFGLSLYSRDGSNHASSPIVNEIFYVI